MGVHCLRQNTSIVGTHTRSVNAVCRFNFGLPTDGLSYGHRCSDIFCGIFRSSGYSAGQCSPIGLRQVAALLVTVQRIHKALLGAHQGCASVNQTERHIRSQRWLRWISFSFLTTAVLQLVTAPVGGLLRWGFVTFALLLCFAAWWLASILLRPAACAHYRIAQMTTILFAGTSLLLISFDTSKGRQNVGYLIVAVTGVTFAKLKPAYQYAALFSAPPLLYVFKRRVQWAYGSVEWLVSLLIAISGTQEFSNSYTGSAWLKVVAGLYGMARGCQNLYEGLERESQAPRDSTAL